MNATIYIRKENEEEWQAIHDKSEWVNTRLASSKKADELYPIKEADFNNIVDKIKKVKNPTEITPLEDLPVIPACCLAKAPCKHWVFDGIDGNWRNSISGEIRGIF